MVLSVQGDEGKPNGNTVQSWTLCINTRRCIKIHVDSQWVKQCPKFSSKASTVPELRTFRCSSWIQKQKRSQRSSCQHLLYRQKSKRVPEKHLLLLYDYTKAFDSVDHNKLWKILQEMGIPDHLTCLLRNLYTGQKATVRTGHGTTDWFQIGKGVRQACILSPCLFNLYAEYIMRNAGLD